MVKTILLSEYVPPTRPYSKDELLDMRKKLYEDLKISDLTIIHKKCSHKYHVKTNGKKEQDIKNNKINKNCSVCWKLKQTQPQFKQLAFEMINAYMNNFYNENLITFYSYNLYDLENVFYTWLYKES